MFTDYIGRLSRTKNKFFENILEAYQEREKIFSDDKRKWMNNGLETKKFSESISGNFDKIKHLKSDVIIEVHDIESEFCDFIDKWATVHGEFITDDAKLLNGGINLTFDMYKDLLNRYKYNFTMLQMLDKFIPKQNNSKDDSKFAECKNILDDMKPDEIKSNFHTLCKVVIDGVNGISDSSGGIDYKTRLATKGFISLIDNFEEKYNLKKLSEFIM